MHRPLTELKGLGDTEIKYGKLSIKDILVQTSHRNEDGTKAKNPEVEIKGRKLQTSTRFWNSIASRYGVSQSTFRYFSPSEVFDRIAKSTNDVDLRACVEIRGDKHTLMAISSPKKETLDFNPVLGVLQRHKGTEFQYDNGIVRARFRPISGGSKVQIAGEDFNNCFQVEVPIDAYGKPKAYLELLKQVCSNGMIGYAPAFRSEFNTDCADPLAIFERSIANYDNDAGFAEMQGRVADSSRAWASVGEAHKLYKILLESSEGMSELSSFAKMTGDLPVIYGLTNMDAITDKRQSVLPSKASVFDLLTFATEVATHKLDQSKRLKMDAYVGQLLSNQFDLEGSIDRIPTFEQFFTAIGPSSAKAKKAKAIA